MKRCPCCGQVIGVDIVLNGPVLQRIYNLLRRGPHSTDDLRNLIWGDRPISYSAIHVEMQLLRRKLKPHGLAIRCDRSWWHSGVYRLEELC